jgi:single-stranded DNA-binding protein
MLNLITTATVSKAEVDEATNKVIVYAIASRMYRNAAGDEVRSNTIFKINLTPRDPAIIHDLVKGARISVEGFFTGDYAPNKDNTGFTANGPRVELKEDGTPRTFITVEATDLQLIGPVEEKLRWNDVTEIMLWGFLGRDAEMQYTQGGKQVTHASIATNNTRYELGEDGKVLLNGEGKPIKINQTIWWRLNIWGDRAATAITHWKKGTALIIWGKPQVDPETGSPQVWERKDGTPSATYELTVSGWAFSPSKRAGGPSDSDYQEPVSNVSNSLTDGDDTIPF